MGGVFGKKKGPIVVTATPKVTRESKSVFKVILIGDAGVGKTSIIIRLGGGNFVEGSSNVTLGSDFKPMVVGEQTFQLWDTGGQERFRTITSSYYRGADIIAVVVDLTYGDSYFNAKTWFQEVDRYGMEKVGKLLVANKVDLTDKRVIDRAALQEMCDAQNIQFLEVSAKDGTGLTDLAEKIVALTARQKL